MCMFVCVCNVLNKQIILLDVEKKFDKIQHSYIIKTQHIGRVRNFPNLIESLYQNSTVLWV